MIFKSYLNDVNLNDVNFFPFTTIHCPIKYDVSHVI